jgi:transcriptional regulator with XRE-family HTH domain
MLTPATCRAGRALLGLTQFQLADLAKIAASTVRNFENGRHAAELPTLRAMVGALEASGVIFIEADPDPEGHGPGVRFARK